MGINSFNDGAADQGSPTSLANAWPVVVTDGTNTVGVTDNNLNVTLGNNPKVGITDYVFSYDNIVSTFGEIKTASTIKLAGVRLPDIGTTNNRRRWGVFSSDLADAAYYEINGTTVNIGIRKGSSDTVVSSFNGGNSFVLDINFTYMRYTIHKVL